MKHSVRLLSPDLRSEVDFSPQRANFVSHLSVYYACCFPCTLDDLALGQPKFYWQVLFPSCNFKICGMLNNSSLGIYIIFLCSFLIYSFHVTVLILVILSSICF